MTTPTNYSYTKTHEWIQFLDEETATSGITDFAQKALSDIVFINMPSEGDEVTCGESFADIESVKAVADINSPVSGTILETNETVEEDPSVINEDPYGSWIVKIGHIRAKDDLMNAEEYDRFCEEEEQ
ncbi:MAG: glycine cleavage system protein GcvH [Clostridiales bacterium]|nr:glycine cleavage system protein GcvH [Clostridiales bacterium]